MLSFHTERTKLPSGCLGRDLPSSQLILLQGYKSRSAGKLSQERRRLSHRKELLDWKLGFCCQTPAEKELELNAKINLHQEASQKKPGLIISTCVSGNTQSLSPSLQGPINSQNKTAWLLDSSKQDSQSCQTSIEKFFALIMCIYCDIIQNAIGIFQIVNIIIENGLTHNSSYDIRRGGHSFLTS